MSQFEGEEFGQGDFVLLENVVMEEFMANLSLRFEKVKYPLLI